MNFFVFSYSFKDNNVFLKTLITDVDTWIFPLIEMGQLDIHHDSVITKELLSSSLKKSKLNLASGYFNLTKDYMETITHNCLAKCSILMAHPNVSINFI